MVETEKTLLSRFYQEFWIFLLLFIFLLVLAIFLFILFFVKFNNMEATFKYIIPVVGILLVFFCIIFAIIFSKYYKDYIYLKSNSPIQMEGELIGYSSIISGDNLSVNKSWPIILVSGDKVEISLNIINAEEKLRKDEVYVFIYLPNTKIAEVIIQ